MCAPAAAVFVAREGTRGIFETLSDPFTPASLANLPARLGTSGTFSFAPAAAVERGMRERVVDDEGMPPGASERCEEEVWAWVDASRRVATVAVRLWCLLSALGSFCSSGEADAPWDDEDGSVNTGCSKRRASRAVRCGSLGRD